MNEYKYYAFISYKSEDVKWAKWLQKKIERYSLPVALQKKNKVPKKLSPIFRDGTDILPKELKKEIREKLEQSRYLIVLCSPRSTSSEYIGEEIDFFCRLGRRDKVIAVIIEGKPYSNDPKTECYHPKLRYWFPKKKKDDKQLLGADIHARGPESNRFKRERAFIQVVATILQMPIDVLWKIRRRYLIFKFGGLFLSFVFVILVISFVWYIGQPFNIDLKMVELSPQNKKLPFEKGRAVLMVEGDTICQRTLYSNNESNSFKNIPGQFKNKEGRLSINIFGYNPIDTVIKINTRHTIYINRDSTYAIYSGHISNEEGINEEGVKVTIEDKSTISDAEGFFCVTFPVSKQTISKKIILSKHGYSNVEYNLQPQKNHCLIIYK